MKKLFAALLLLSLFTLPIQAQLPIKPTRTISFTTDEGSNMDVDISPDGKTLVFDLLGDLYTVPVTGGNATQLTRGLAFNLRPVWSPNGKRIAYISDISGDSHLNIRDIARGGHLILGQSDELHQQNILWTPDGNYIAIEGHLYGTTGTKLSLPISFSHPLRFSADGKSVYYLDSSKIYRYDYSTKSRIPIAALSLKHRRGELSPDGRWWAYVVDSNSKKCLVVSDLVSNTERTLIPSLVLKYPSYVPATASRYTFSSNSRKLFIGYGGKIHCIDVEHGDDQIIPFTANVKSDLGTYNYHTVRVSHDSVRVKYTRSANASPDGMHLVFSALDKLYVMDLPKGKAHVFAPQSIAQFQPVYSPDGKWIAYVSWSDTAGGFLWRAPITGNGLPEQLTQVPGQYQLPTWSPDGKWIAVVAGTPRLGDRDDPGFGKLELISVKGEPSRIIDDTVTLVNQLDFSSDGSRIIYQPFPRNQFDKNPSFYQLVSKGIEAGDTQPLFTGTDPLLLRQKRVSPDGHYLVYSVDEDLYLVPICKLTASQVICDQHQPLSAIRFAAGVDPFWEKGGKVLSWTYGNRFYRVNPDKIVDIAEKAFQKEGASGLPSNNYATITIQPDEVVDLNVTVPAFYAHGLIALRNVRIITMHGNQVIEHGTILIKDGRFIAVGPTTSVSIPKGTKVLELPGTTVMPGLVDVHLHMRVPSNVFPQQSWMFLANLAYGVTTARDPALSFDSYGYKELLASGQMIGPRLNTVGRAANITAGMMRCDNLNDARAYVHKHALLGSTEIKQYELPTRQQRQWLLIACREAGLNMTNEGAGILPYNLGMIKDGSTGVEHNPVWGDVYKDVLSFYAASRTYITPTLQVNYGTEYAKAFLNYKYWRQADAKLTHFVMSDPRMKSPTSNGAESIEVIMNTHPKDTLHPGFLPAAIIDAQLLKQGAHITLGSHGNDEGIGPHNELWALQMGGISNMEALRVATLAGAEALGMQKDIGSIEVGKIADLIILNKNPLEDIHNSREIRYVMKDGVLYDGDTLDILWPVAKKCPEWLLHK